jgi:MFS family permease
VYTGVSHTLDFFSQKALIEYGAVYIYSMKGYLNIPKGIWVIGIASFFLNVSSVILFSLTSVYLNVSLGVGGAAIGFLEGIMEGVSYLVKLLSGLMSDFLQKRKWIMVIGFGLCVLARPIMALQISYWNVFISRILDRIGNGIQATPRDALVGDISPPNVIGRAYGLRQALATAGSVAGGILGSFLLKKTHDDLSVVFWIATIPAIVGLILLMLFVHDFESPSSVKKKKMSFKDISSLGYQYWILMGVSFLFMLARLGEAFLILHGKKNFDIDMSFIPYIAVLYNGASSMISYPIGQLSDRINRYVLLGCGMAVMIVADLLLYIGAQQNTFLMSCVLWGVQLGMTQSMFIIIIADLIPRHLRGTADGIFHLINAIGYMLSSQIAGFLMDAFGVRSTFVYGGIVSLFSLCVFVACQKYMTVSRQQK